jgi:hypothetical protein
LKNKKSIIEASIDAPVYRYNETMEGSISQSSYPSSIDENDLDSRSSLPTDPLDKMDEEVEEEDEEDFEEEPEDNENVEDDVLQDYENEIKVQTIIKESNSSLRQKPFQTGASGVLEQRRFLAHNNVGLIASQEGSNSNYIEIEFNDVSKHKNDRFTDHFSSDIAALGDSGAVFANKSLSKTQASLTFKSFNSWSNESQWRVNMEDEEQIETVAVCTDFVLASTKTEDGQCFLRVFSTNGIQLSVLAFPSQIISMCGNKNNLAVLYYEDDQSTTVKFKYFNMATSKLLAESTVPKSTKSNISWIGFSNLGVRRFIHINISNSVSMIPLDFSKCLLMTLEVNGQLFWTILNIKMIIGWFK